MKVIWFSEIKWSYLRTRKQQLISRFPSEWRILFIEPVVKGKSNAYRPRKDGNVMYVTVPFFKGTPFSWLNKVQSSFPGRWLLQILIFFWVKILLLFSGFSGRDRIIFTSNVYYANIIRRLKRKLLLYDCNDYPLGFAARLPIVDFFFRKTASDADVVTTVSTKLASELKGHRRDDIIVIGNGADTELFRGPFETPEDFPPAPRPLIFFSGAVSEWFDVGLLQRLHREIPQAGFIVLGPVKDAATGIELEEFGKLPRVFLLPEKKHHELPAYMAQADVCVFPAKFNQRSLGSNPNTIYEFMACGKPVVTMALSDELRNLADVIGVADNHDEFVVAVKGALRGDQNTEKIRSRAVEHDWSQKAKQMVGAVEFGLKEIR